MLPENRIHITEEVAKVIITYGKERDMCYFLEGTYRFGAFSVRYRLTQPTNFIFFDGAMGLRAARDFITGMQAEYEGGIEEDLADLECQLSDMLRPTAI